MATPLMKKRNKSPDKIELLNNAQLAAILKKAGRGKPLTAAEMEFARGRLGGDAGKIADRKSKIENRKSPGGDEVDDVDLMDGPAYVSPAAFLRFVADQGDGISLSKKSLYHTYIGAKAKYRLQFPLSGDGRKIHKLKGLEFVRMVQVGDTGGGDDMQRAFQIRALADARAHDAKARILERRDLLDAGQYVPRVTVEKVWATATENFKNKLRALTLNLPLELQPGFSVGLHEAFRDLAVMFAAKAAGKAEPQKGAEGAK